ncbi:MAG: helix-turn-helix transcriptional regulator [Actinobacteria bacterium]|nr:helix-turn-helix transcriptional regulator [Actinomycetota bacterium]MDI6830537.1 PadR family transcriptional regulator [Actinomycetota bacterium]
MQNKSSGGAPSDVGFYIREGPGKRFIEPRILFLLLQGPAHGYELLGRMEEVPMPGPLPDAGAVYRKLRDMEGRGLVVSDWDDRGSGPRRRVYRITREGRRRLELWVTAMRERMHILQRFLDLYETTGAH